MKSFKQFIVEVEDPFTLAPGQSVAGTNYDWDPNYRNLQIAANLNPVFTGEAQTPLDIHQSMNWFFSRGDADSLPENHPYYQQWISWLNQWIKLTMWWNHIPPSTAYKMYNDLYRRYVYGNNGPPWGYHPPIGNIVNRAWPLRMPYNYNKDGSASCYTQYPDWDLPCYTATSPPTG